MEVESCRGGVTLNGWAVRGNCQSLRVRSIP